jgi:hypothetical protein
MPNSKTLISFNRQTNKFISHILENFEIHLDFISIEIK